MRTKMPSELAPGDRLVVRGLHGEMTGQTKTVVAWGLSMMGPVLVFDDGDAIPIRENLPIEVAE